MLHAKHNRLLMFGSLSTLHKQSSRSPNIQYEQEVLKGCVAVSNFGHLLPTLAKISLITLHKHVIVRQEI